MLSEAALISLAERNLYEQGKLNNFSCPVFLSDQISHNEGKINLKKEQLLLTGKQHVQGEQQGGRNQPDRAQKHPPQAYACKQVSAIQDSTMREPLMPSLGNQQGGVPLCSAWTPLDAGRAANGELEVCV